MRLNRDMTRAIYYPPADRSVQWFGDTFDGSPIEPNCQVWHTTETEAFPSYGGGASAPHLTYHPKLRKWRQHFRLDRSSRALRNLAGGVETNTLNTAQVEIVAYSDEALAASVGGTPVSELPDAALHDLGDYAAWMRQEWGLELTIDPGWVRSNYRNPTRMTNAQWLNFNGHTGHNRVPENTHFDPARLDIDTLILYAQGEDMPLTSDEIDKIADRVWKKDGLIRNQSTADVNDPAAYGPPNWFLSDLENTQDKDHQTLVQVAQDVTDLKTAVSQIVIGGLNYDLLANKVADVLAARLQS